MSHVLLLVENLVRLNAAKIAVDNVLTIAIKLVKDIAQRIAVGLVLECQNKDCNMNKILIIISFVIMSLVSYAKYDINSIDSIPVYSLRHEQRDTINFKHRMSQNDRKLIVYCASWCPLSYKEFNLLYSQGIINKLKEKDFHLIIVADKSPFLNLNHSLIEGNWNEHVMEDFEIYYDIEWKALKAISGDDSIPHLVVMNKSEVLIESHGLKEDYSFIVDTIKGLDICQVCNGSGRVTPRPQSYDPDLPEGICRLCGGKGNI